MTGGGHLMSLVLLGYAAGAVATLIAGCVGELRWPASQRRPLSARVGLALLWPLYLLFLAAVAITARREQHPRA
jgi:hypothetical protein